MGRRLLPAATRWDVGVGVPGSQRYGGPGERAGRSPPADLPAQHRHFDGRHPRAWLLTILRNAQVNRSRRRRPQLLDDPDLATDRGLNDAQDSAEDVVVGRTFDVVVDAALSALPTTFRLVVLLVDVDGLTHAEAAEVLGVPEGTVMSRLHRARRRIRDRLYLDGEVDDLTARRVARHLELCRRCGLEASTYAEIKKALARRGAPVPGDAHERLQRLAEQLMDTPPDQSAANESC